MKKILLLAFVLLSLKVGAQKPLTDSSAMFHRIGLVFADSAGRNFEAPTCIYEGSPQILTGLSKVFKLWFTWIDASLHVNIGYAESADGIGHWFRKATAVIAGHRSSCVRKFGSTYFCYTALGLGGSQIDEYTSTDGVTWTLSNSAIITLGATNTWNGTGLFNSWVDSIGSTYYMILDGQSVQYGFSDGLYTSTDNATWTPYSGNPILPFITSPYWTHFGTNVVVWGGSPMFNSILPTDIYRMTSPDFHTWTASPIMPVLRRETAFEGVNSIFGQVQDMCDVQVVLPSGDTCVYRYFLGTVNGNSSGGAGIELAIYHGSQKSLVAGNENADKFPRFEDGGTNPYFNQPFAMGTPVAPVAMIDIEPITGRFGGSASLATGNVVQDSSYSQLAMGYNMEFAAGISGGWRQRNPTLIGYDLVFNSSGITHNAMVAGASNPTPVMTESYNGTNGLFQFGSAPHPAHVMIGAPDDLSGDVLQVTGASEFGNITGNTFNTDFFGKGASASNTNLGIGTTNPFGASTGTNNLAIQSFMNSLTGGSNVGIAQGAGSALTSGNFNTFVGTIAGNSATTGSNNTAFGRAALFSVTTGSENSAFGPNSGRSVTTHNLNTDIGGEAGYQTPAAIASSSTGDTATALGWASQHQCSSCGVLGAPGKLTDRWSVGIMSPTAFMDLPSGLGITGFSALKLHQTALTTTALAGNGSQMTFTFATQPAEPFMVGQFITVTGAVPSGYNGNWQIGAVTTTTITVVGTITGSQTSAGTITANSKPTTADLGAFGNHLDSLFWIAPSGTAYNITFPSGGSGVTTIGTFSGTSIANGASISGVTLTLGVADGTNPGMVSTTAQTIAGAKTFSGNASFTSNTTFIGGIYGNSGTPTAVAGTGAGTSPSITVSGTNVDGTVTITPGTGAVGTSAVIVTITLANSLAFLNAPIVVLTPANAATALLSGATMVYVVPSLSTPTTAFTINAGTTGLTPATTYSWNYHCAGY